MRYSPNDANVSHATDPHASGAPDAHDADRNEHDAAHEHAVDRAHAVNRSHRATTGLEDTGLDAAGLEDLGLDATVFVLVHGAWHSSWQWAATQRALAGLGSASVAVDLPGHGFGAPLPSGYLLPGRPGLLTERSQLADLTMDDCADAVLDTLRRVRHYGRVVLVAHSAGGGPASLAVERAPELVDRVVYLSAFVPAGRPRFLDYLSAPESAAARGQNLKLGDPAALGALRIDPLSPDPAYVEELRQTHYHDTPADRFDRWRGALSPDLPLALPTTPVALTARRWGRVPRTFLRCADDRALPSAAQDLMIAEADRAMPGEPFTVLTLPGSHSPFAARPRELAEALTLPLTLTG